MDAVAPKRALLLDEGDPRNTPRHYRRALSQFATGVAVLTAAGRTSPVFVTVNSFASVSLDPPLILWSLRRASSSLKAFQNASHFAVNVLASDQVEIASRFARSGPPPNEDLPSAPGLGGAPLLPDVAASFECRCTAEHDGGDHVIFIGEVERYRCYDRGGLLFAQGRYALAVDHPESEPRIEFDHPPDAFLAPLLLRAYSRLSAEFNRHREALDLDLDQTKALTWLAAHPGASNASLARGALLGMSAAEDSLAALIGKGLVAPRPPGAVVVTDQGRQVVSDLLARAEAFEREKLKGFDAATVTALRGLLKAIAEGAG